MTTIDIHGHRTWVIEHRNDGEPVLLLHPGLSDSDPMLEVFEPALPGHRLLAFDRRGHGRTADTDAPFSYRTMADEAVGVLEAFHTGPGHLVGVSDGAITALHVALARPDLVATLVLNGAVFHHTGLLPVVIEDGSPYLAQARERYAHRSPDGAEHFDAVLAKSRAMWATEPTLTVEDLHLIEAPTLVVVGDDDNMTLAHSCALYEALPNGRFAVVAGASHLVAFEKRTLMATLVGDFIRHHEPPATQFPIRRRAA
jgi:pimeloyl-ACP methyl ester carboxylesterase